MTDRTAAALASTFGSLDTGPAIDAPNVTALPRKAS